MTPRAIALALLTVAAISAHAATKPDPEATRAVDEMCGFMGVRRASIAQNDDGWLHVDLMVDGRRLRYRVELAQRHHRLTVETLMPDKFDWDGVRGLGFDTLKDPQARAITVAAVRRANTYLHWKWASGPQIQRLGSGTVVSYETVTPQGQARHGYTDAYVHFLVSPKGTVYGFFMGG